MCIRDRSIPYSIRAAGFSGVLLFALVTSVLAWTLVVVLTGGAMSSEHTAAVVSRSKATFADYSVLGQAAWGNRGEALALVVVFCELWLGLISYLILIGLNVEAAFPDAPRWLVILGCGAAAGTMALLHLNKLAFFSGFALFITAASCVLMITSGALIPDSAVTSDARDYKLVNTRGLPESLGLIFFTFAGFPIFPKLYSNMQHKQLFPRVVTASFSAIFLLYAGLGAAGYYLFGNYTQESFTQNIGRHLDGQQVPTQRWMAVFVGLGMSLNKLLTSPLLLIAVTDGVLNVCGWTGKLRWRVVMVTLCALATLLAILLKDHFAAFTALVGSLASVTASLLLPLAFYAKLVLPTHAPGRGRNTMIALLSICGLFGLVCAAIGTLNGVCSIAGTEDGACALTVGWKD
eukprot:TRINITY_DN3851_c0_g1_i2.p1 TRINITY_DN3851_c0_g1~~TRINITY_DN3851_c0_g1_i2.p1  ORF type:complete len:405 (+),score=78.79 TRINITY_DN3851_c0_g1_i2:86-1300(+)